jgi:hypothetical protein
MRKATNQTLPSSRDNEYRVDPELLKSDKAVKPHRVMTKSTSCLTPTAAAVTALLRECIMKRKADFS